MVLNILEWIQDWFSKNCDGDWEHAQNLTITTIDNPGWSVTINLKGTTLEDRVFKTVDVNKSDADWFFCTIKNHEFQGDGGTKNLINILEVFCEWAEK